MRSLPKPTDESGVPYVTGEVFDLCLSTIESKTLKQRLVAIRTDVEAAAERYDRAGARSALHNFPQSSAVKNVTGKEIKDIYTDRLVPKKQPARPIYDRILMAPKHGKCPLCDVGMVDTLDHYLPKSKFTLLSVTPNNLVPSCWLCQRKKLSQLAGTKEDQTLHPYFDSFQETRTWLKARVIKTSPPSFEFFVDAPADWQGLESSRLIAHLKAFNLKVLYSANAASELSGIRHNLKTLFEADGETAVRTFLLEAAVSREQVSVNSWSAAMYRAAAMSTWFCRGAFMKEG